MKILKYVCSYTICMLIYFSIIAIPIMFEHVTTHYQTLETWIDHNATRYHNFNLLPYAFHTFYLSLAWFWAISNACDLIFDIFEYVFPAS